MALDAVKIALFLAAAVSVSAGAVLALARFAPVLGLLDEPG